MKNKNQLAPPAESIINDFTQLEITEASFNDEKKELMVTLLREGPGNKLHNNYYTKSAIESVAREVQDRKKQYYNHAKDVDNPDRDLRDWASSILETHVEESDGKSKLVAKVKVFDDWLWKRAKVAPGELSVSLEGKGSGRKEVIEGHQYNAIHDIRHVNGVNWVDYPGNAGMGVKILEKERSYESKEDKNMLKEVLEGLKDLTEEELKEVATAKPELKEFFMFGAPKQDSKTEKEITELRESVKNMKDASVKLVEVVESLKKDKIELSNKVEAHEIKGKAIDKEKLVDKILGESKLKDEHKTDTFREQLLKSEKDEDMKKLIEDREKICITEKADTKQDGDGKDKTEISETDKIKKFSMGIFGVEVSDEDIAQAV